MKQELINIITRASRFNFFKNCYDSIHLQGYDNLMHYITYENDTTLDFLKSYVKHDNVILVKVPQKKRIPDLYISWNHHPETEDYINPDFDFLDYRLGKAVEYAYVKLPVNRKDFKLKNGSYTTTPPETWRMESHHFPYNLYINYVQQYITDGWIFYLDDDDIFYNKDILHRFNEEISKFDEDTLHVVKIQYPNGDLVPNDHYTELYDIGFPFTFGQMGGACLLFHSKYKDYTYWDEWGNSDYRTAVALRKAIPKLNSTNIISTRLITGTNFGLDKEI